MNVAIFQNHTSLMLETIMCKIYDICFWALYQD